MSALHMSNDGVLGRLVALGALAPRPVDAMILAAEQLRTSLPCESVVVLGWDGELQALVEQARSPAGDGENCCFRPGEGVSGLCALRLETITEVDEQSGMWMRAVPILSREESLLGVLCVSGAEGGALPSAAAHLVDDVARLLALLVDYHAVRERTSARGSLLDLIDLAVSAGDPHTSLDHTLAEVATLALRVTPAAACAVYRREPHRNTARRVAFASADARLTGRLRPETTWEDLEEAPVDRVVPGALKTIVAPVTGPAGERLGAMLVVDSRPGDFTAEQRATVRRLAQTVAVAIGTQRLVESSSSQARAVDLLWELVTPGGTDPLVVEGRARRLGCDLVEDRLVAVIDGADRARREQIARAVAETERCALVDPSAEPVIAALRPTTLARLSLEGLSVGLSRPCSDPSGYPGALREAREALEVGTLLWGASRVTHFEALGSYRFIPALVECGLTRDAAYHQVSRLPTDLLETLETYLDCAGNTAQAARKLFLHRNTLRQRLDRISSLLAMDLASSSGWLSLQLVVKAVRMARLAPVPGPSFASPERPPTSPGVRETFSLLPPAAAGRRQPRLEPVDVGRAAPVPLLRKRAEVSRQARRLAHGV